MCLPEGRACRVRCLEGRACRVRKTTLDDPSRFIWRDKHAPPPPGGTCLSGPPRNVGRSILGSAGMTGMPLRLLAEPSRTDALVASIELNIPVRDLADCLKGLMNLIQRPQTHFRSYPRAKGIEAPRFSKHDIGLPNEAFGWERTIRDH